MATHLITEPFLRQLGSDQTRRALKLAVRERASIMLESDQNSAAAEYIGYILDGNENGLVVILNANANLAADPRNIDRRWNVRFFLGEETYLFSARILDIDGTGPLPAIRLALPDGLFAEARRKFQRARFAESADVEITFVDDRPPASATGKLCNVSADGIAVLVDENITRDRPPHPTVTVRFDLPHCGEPFVLPSFVRALTPAGTHEKTIIRLQFVRNASVRSDRLLQNLQRYLDDYFGRKLVQE